MKLRWNRANKTDEEMVEASAEQARGRWHITPRVIPWIVVLAALLVAVAASVGLFGGDADAIALPSGSGDKLRRTQEEQTFALTDADITLENVQQVIENLRRPEAYSVAIDNTVFWNQDWSTCQVNQYVRDGVCLTEYYDTTQEIERYEMIADDVYYAWRAGRSKYHRSSTGSLTADQTAMIPTYETIVDTDPSELTDAGLRTVNNVPCIYCVVQDPDSGYTITYSVSTVTGLLSQADYSRGDEIVRNVSITAVNMEKPKMDLFALPDGTQLPNIQYDEAVDSAVGTTGTSNVTGNSIGTTGTASTGTVDGSTTDSFGLGSANTSDSETTNATSNGLLD